MAICMWVAILGVGERERLTATTLGLLVVSGRVNGCCTKLGNSNRSVLVNRKIRAGATEVVHHGYLFVLRIKSK